MLFAGVGKCEIVLRRQAKGDGKHQIMFAAISQREINVFCGDIANMLNVRGKRGESEKCLRQRNKSFFAGIGKCKYVTPPDKERKKRKTACRNVTKSAKHVSAGSTAAFSTVHKYTDVNIFHF